MTTVILANGSFPAAEEPLRLLDTAERVVCCDGAAEACLAHGRVPEVVIGDLDSLSPQVRQRLSPQAVIHVTEQETNDLAKAFRYCLAQNWRNLVILGATGRREDHTLGNIAHLADFARQVPSIRMVTDDGEFLVLNGSGTVSCEPGQQVSLFVLEADTPIESEGLVYPLNGLSPSRWWQATLNEATGTSFTLQFPAGRQLLVFLAKP